MPKNFKGKKSNLEGILDEQEYSFLNFKEEIKNCFLDAIKSKNLKGSKDIILLIDGRDHISKNIVEKSIEKLEIKDTTFEEIYLVCYDGNLKIYSNK